MKILVSPKDTLCKIEFDNVKTYYQEGHTLAIVMEDGAVRNYPLEHIWYYEKTADIK
jgi:hypothetical protein